MVVEIFLQWYNLNGLETIYCLILKLSHLDIMHQVYLMPNAVPVCLRAGMTVFWSDVCTCSYIRSAGSTLHVGSNVQKLFNDSMVIHDNQIGGAQWHCSESATSGIFRKICPRHLLDNHENYECSLHLTSDNVAQRCELEFCIRKRWFYYLS